MNAMFLLLTPTFPVQLPAESPIVAEVAPAPAVVPDAQQLAAWMADLSGTDYNRQIAAVNGLVKAGPRVKAHVSELIKLLADKEGRSDQAIQILTAIGPDAKEAVPALLALIRENRWGYFVDRVAMAIARIEGPRPEATRALLLSYAKCTPIMLTASQYLREYPAQVIPHLVGFCGDKELEIQKRAVTVLGGLDWSFNAEEAKTILAKAGDGAKGVPAALERLLSARDLELRMLAAQAVASAAPELAEKTIAVVIAAVAETKPEQLHSIPAAEIFRTIPGPATKALMPFLEHEKDPIRGWAIGTLAAVGIPEELDAVLKTGKSARARQGAALALGMRYGDSARSAPALTAALGDPEFIVRFAAATGLVQLFPRGGDSLAPAVPVLINGLQQKDAETRIAASEALVRVGEPAKTAVPALKKMLADKNSAVALEAALTLTELAPADTAEAIPVLIRGLSNSGRTTIRSANALRKIGPPAIAAIPELVKLFDAKDVKARIPAIVAATTIDPTQAGKATEALVAILKDKALRKDYLRQDAATALAQIGPGAKAALPAVLELLKEENSIQSSLAVAAVAIDRDSAKEAREWIANVIAGKNQGEDPTELTDQIRELGPRAKAFIPELLLLLQSKTPYLRREAAEILGELGSAATEALPLLKNLAEKDKVETVRKAAAGAVKRIETK